MSCNLFSFSILYKNYRHARFSRNIVLILNSTNYFFMSISSRAIHYYDSSPSNPSNCKSKHMKTVKAHCKLFTFRFFKVTQFTDSALNSTHKSAIKISWSSTIKIQKKKHSEYNKNGITWRFRT